MFCSFAHPCLGMPRNDRLHVFAQQDESHKCVHFVAVITKNCITAATGAFLCEQMPAKKCYVGGRESPKDWIMLDIAKVISGPVCAASCGFASDSGKSLQSAAMAGETQQSNSENVTGRIT